MSSKVKGRFVCVKARELNSHTKAMQRLSIGPPEGDASVMDHLKINSKSAAGCGVGPGVQ
jgi:hypothetical protein